MAFCFSRLYILGFCVPFQMFPLKELFPIVNNLKATVLQYKEKKKKKWSFFVIASSIGKFTISWGCANCEKVLRYV